MKGPLIIARLGPLTREVKRIADALETLLLYQYGYRTRTMPVPKSGGPPPEVLYADSRSAAIRELQRIYTGDPSFDPDNLEDAAEEGEAE